MNKRYRDILRTIEAEGIAVNSVEKSTGTGHMHIVCEYRGTTWPYVTGAPQHPSTRKFKKVQSDMRRAKRNIDAQATRSSQPVARRPVERSARKLSPLGKPVPSR